MRKLPYPKIKSNASALVKVSTGITINGSEEETSWEGDVIYNEHHRWSQTTEGKKVEGTGKIYIFHDIVPEATKLTGTVVVKGDIYTFSGSRYYNPDGSVHHVELRLM